MNAQDGGKGIIPDLGEIPLARELAWGTTQGTVVSSSDSSKNRELPLMSSQITVRTRDCVGRPSRPPFIGDLLDYRGHEWVVVGLFMGADPITSEIEEYLILEGGHALERREESGRTT